MKDWWLKVEGGPMHGAEFYDGVERVAGLWRVNVGERSWPGGVYYSNGKKVIWVPNK